MILGSKINSPKKVPVRFGESPKGNYVDLCSVGDFLTDSTKINHHVSPPFGEYLDGGFKYVLFSPRNLGKIPTLPILTNIFQRD